MRSRRADQRLVDQVDVLLVLLGADRDQAQRTGVRWRGDVGAALAGEQSQHALAGRRLAVTGNPRRLVARDALPRVAALVVDAGQPQQQFERRLPALGDLAVDARQQRVGLRAEHAGDAVRLAVALAAEDISLALLPERVERVLDQRQRTDLVTRVREDRRADFADVEAGEPRRLLDDFAQPVLGDRRQEVALAEAVVDFLQARQLFEAIEEVGAHGTDQEQRTLGVLQRPGEQGVELLARCRVGEGEQFLELVDDQQECGLLFPGVAQVERQYACALVLCEALRAGAGVAPLAGGDQGVLDDLRQLLQRVPARHHRPEDSPALAAGARPQRSLFDHRQQAGIDQRRLAGAAVALDLQPAAEAGAAGAQPVGVGRLLLAEARERLEGFLAASEEQPGILAGEGVEADEGAALDGRRRVEADGARPDGVEQCGRQRLGRPPAGGLEEDEKRRQRLRPGVFEEDREQRQALGVLRRRQVADQGHLHLGADPAAHAFPADENDERRAAVQGLLQALQPPVAGAQRIVILEDTQPGLFERRAQGDRHRLVSAAVAEKDAFRRLLVGRRHRSPLLIGKERLLPAGAGQGPFHLATT